MNTQSKLKKIKGNKQKLKLFRSKEPLKSVLMWGISYSMSQLSHVKRKPVLMDEDFKGYIKAAIENHQFNKEFMPSHYKFKEYAPMVFLDLRKRFQVDDKEYLESLTACPPIRLRKGPKKKDSSLLLSHDRKFVIRIISNDDVSFIQSWLAEYHEHVLQKNGETLLSHILGLYRLTVNDQHTHLVIMRNINHPTGSITRLYILDGLLEKQLAAEKDRKDTQHYDKMTGAASNTAPPISSSPPQQSQLTGNPDIQQLGGKHKNFADSSLFTDEVRIYLLAEEKERLMTTLRDDMMFLETNRIHKYKLLLGLRDIEGQRFKLNEEENLAGSSNKNQSAFAANQLYSEEEIEDEVQQPGFNSSNMASSPTSQQPAVESDDDEVEVENAMLASIPGNRIGQYGIRDRTDPTIVYYVGVIDFFKRRGVTSSGSAVSKSERKASLAAASLGNATGNTVAGTNNNTSAMLPGIRRDSSGTSPPTNNPLVTSGDIATNTKSAALDQLNCKQLSGRLLNTLSYCLV